MQVLHLTASNARRGPEIFAFDLVDRLAARGIGGRVLAVAPALDAETVAIEPLAARRWSLRAFLRLRAEVARAVVAGGPRPRQSIRRRDPLRLPGDR
jgi:hypothetical protein